MFKIFYNTQDDYTQFTQIIKAPFFDEALAEARDVEDCSKDIKKCDIVKISSRSDDTIKTFRKVDNHRIVFYDELDKQLGDCIELPNSS